MPGLLLIHGRQCTLAVMTALKRGLLKLLPLQSGSYLLNSEFQPVWSDQTTFLQHWQFARSRNTIDSGAIKRVLKQFRRHRFRISGKADKYLNDLNTEIELGWTGPGQTN